MRFSSLFTPFNSTPAVMEAPTALVLVGFIFLIAFQTIALLKGQQFDPQGFGMALGMLMGGGGAASYGQGYMLRSRSITSGSAAVDNPDGGA